MLEYAEACRRELDRRRISGGRLKGFEQAPGGFIRSVLGEHLWSRQEDICRSVLLNRRTAVKSCHQTGKSYLAARLACWWLSSCPTGDAFVVTSAPTFKQVRAILWREIKRAHAKGRLPGHTNQTEWLIDGELVAFGQKPDDTDPTAFQGIHARRVLVIFDEACGIPKMLWDGADTLIANDDSRFFAIGNPDDPASEFAEVCKPGSGWNVITISAFSTPNFTDEPIPQDLHPLLIGRTWVEEKRRSWGEASPLWQSKILGEFPEIGDDTLISPARIIAARDRELSPATPVELGVDVARFGPDESVIVCRRGDVARIHATSRLRDLMFLVGMIVKAIRETGATRVKIDDPGMGGGVTDRLDELRSEGEFKAEIVPINVGEGPTTEDAKRQFGNLRAELHWALRDRFESGQIDIEDDDELLSQLGATRYRLNSRGRLQIESKEEMKKRGLPSPDRADALMLSFAEPRPMSSAGFLEFYKRQAAAASAGKAA